MLLFFSLPAYGQKKPDWVSTHPVSFNAYIGIGHAKKKNNEDYKEDAKQAALAEISSSISVKVSGESLFSQSELDNTFKEEFTATVQTRSKNEIYGLTKFKEWENRKEYWSFYRVDKQEYEKIKSQKIKTAVDKGIKLYQKGLEYDRKNEIAKALYYYGESLFSVESFLSEDLKAENEFGETIYLGKELLNRIYSIQKDLRFDYKMPRMGASAVRGDYLEISCKRKNKAAGDIPLIIFADDDDFDGPLEIIADHNGKASVLIPFQLRAFGDTKMGIGVDFQKLLKSNIKHDELQPLFKKLETQYTTFMLNTSTINGKTNGQYVTTNFPDKKKSNGASNIKKNNRNKFIGRDGYTSFDQMYYRLDVWNISDRSRISDLKYYGINFTLSAREVKRLLRLFESNEYKLECVEILLDHMDTIDGLYDLISESFKRKERKRLKEIIELYI